MGKNVVRLPQHFRTGPWDCTPRPCSLAPQPEHKWMEVREEGKIPQARPLFSSHCPLLHDLRPNKPSMSFLTEPLAQAGGTSHSSGSGTPCQPKWMDLRPQRWASQGSLWYWAWGIDFLCLNMPIVLCRVLLPWAHSFYIHALHSQTYIHSVYLVLWIFTHIKSMHCAKIT